MKPHVWEKEEIDGGPIGADDFWICHGCGASGGPVFVNREAPTFPPFFADGSGLKVSDDCEESREIITKHKESRTA